MPYASRLERRSVIPPPGGIARRWPARAECRRGERRGRVVFQLWHTSEVIHYFVLWQKETMHKRKM